MRIQEQSQKLALQMTTEIKGMGFIAFEAREVSAGNWGFAFGFDFMEGDPKGLPGLDFLGTFQKNLNLRKLMLILSSFDGAGFQFPDAVQLNAFSKNRIPPGKKINMPSSASGVVRGLNLFAEWSLDTGGQQAEDPQEAPGPEPCPSMS